MIFNEQPRVLKNIVILGSETSNCIMGDKAENLNLQTTSYPSGKITAKVFLVKRYFS